MKVMPSAAIVRGWSDELLDDHLQFCIPSTSYVCVGCAGLQRREFEMKAVADNEVTSRLVEGWL